MTAWWPPRAAAISGVPNMASSAFTSTPADRPPGTGIEPARDGAKIERSVSDAGGVIVGPTPRRRGGQKKKKKEHKRSPVLFFPQWEGFLGARWRRARRNNRGERDGGRTLGQQRYHLVHVAPGASRGQGFHALSPTASHW